MSKLVTGLTVAALFVGGTCFATNTGVSAQRTKPTPVAASATARGDNGAETESGGGYLGIVIEPRQSLIVEDLEHLFGRGQGVLVSQVAEDSPAAKAGLQRDDVVVTYDDQKVYSPMQLARLVQNDKPGRKATLGIVRSNQTKKLTVVLGDRGDATTQIESREPYTSMNEQRLLPGSEMGVEEAWRTFDSLVLQREGQDRFKAGITYRDDNGKVVSREFEGSIANIRKDIKARPDMPVVEREHLLHALDVSEHPSDFSWPALPM